MKKIIAGAVALLFAGAVFAQDMGFDDFGSFDMGSFDDSKMEADTGIKLGADIEYGARLYVDQYEDSKAFKDWTVDHNPKMKLDLGYSGASTDFAATLKFDKYSLGSFNEDILDEFSIRAYLGNFQLEAGKMRLVWGKGDKLHVLDNFNANDYTDFLIPDYIDRRIAEPMFRAVYATPSNVKIEAVYAPMMTPDRYGSGKWTPKAQKTLTDTVTGIAKGNTEYLIGQIAGAGTLTGAQVAQAMAALASASQFSSDSLYEDTKTFQYGQAGTRLTFTLGGVDLGVSYYYGHIKQVSVDKKALIDQGVAASRGAANLSALKGILSYDPVHIFGLEGAFVIPGAGLNTRFELAYNMTNDFDGTDPKVHNHFLSWVAGFDRDIPLHNININIQTQGKVVFNNDKIEANRYKIGGLGDMGNIDVDFVAKDSDEKKSHATNNKIVLLISDTWNYEKIKLEVKGIYGIERNDLIVMPTLTFKLVDSFCIDLSGLYIWGKDKNSEFDGWNHNSFAQIKCRMSI